ncbi:methyltransferase domain-containing protein [Halotia wernerae UHCC 0503]|nr:methyltransferase domain-containing protein [Halotia wernerae UHCC 0503]
MTNREPHWRVNGKDDWGLTPLKSYDFIKEFLCALKQLLSLVSYKSQSRKINKCLQQFEIVKISLGSGRDVPDGWIGLDSHKSGKRVFPVNLLLGIPLKDDSVHEILAEHIIEHFFFDDVYWLLSECYRVLSPGGKLRIVCPDAKNIAELILKGHRAETDHDVIIDSKTHRWPDDGLRWARFINRLSHQWGQHKSLLSREIISQILGKVGFDHVVQVSINESIFFNPIPDIHSKRFPDDGPNLNLAIEASIRNKKNLK